MKKLTVAQLDVLRAYRDGTKHMRSTKVTARLLSMGLLESYWDSEKQYHTLRITEAGKQALGSH